MIIKEIVEQNRRDFTAVYVCEHCGAERRGSGYDDDNFHRYVVPTMECKSCGKRANVDDFRPLGTKYPEGQVV